MSSVADFVPVSAEVSRPSAAAPGMADAPGTSARLGSAVGTERITRADWRGALTSPRASISSRPGGSSAARRLGRSGDSASPFPAESTNTSMICTPEIPSASA